MFFIKNIQRKLAHLFNFKQLRISYSQEGEDVLIERILHFKKRGFYIDIGAYHPVKYSNTYKFYVNGWQGINVDAMPGSMEAFKKIRPRDINIEVPVSDKSEMLTYHIFNEPALNTLSEKEAKTKDGLGGYKIVDSKLLLTKRLDEILEENLLPGTVIDFLSVDAEGFDLKVLQSNNWNKFRPQVVITENLSENDDFEFVVKGAVNQFMTSCNYKLVAKTLNTLFFVKNDFQFR